MKELAAKIRTAVTAHPRVADVALALLIAGTEVFYVVYYLRVEDCACDVGLPAALAIALCTTIPLAWRRDHPFAIAAVTGSATFIGSLLTVPLLGFGAPVAVFTVASLGSKTIRAVTAAIVTVAMIANPILEGDYQAVPEDLLIYGGAWVLGALARTRRAYTEELEAKAELLEREREERSRLAVAEERGNIARELHDIVAHGVTAMVVQSEAARSVLHEDPEAADRALQSIQTVGRKNLDDLRRLLGVLRSAGESPIAPHASLDELDALLEDARSTGLDVDLRVSGEPSPLTASTGLSAYRIIQESLTNVLKHSRAGRASVDVSWGPDEVVITVADPGPSNARNGRNGGHGIVGMRERAALVGGSVDVRTTPEGANVVTARLPVDAR